MKVSAIIPAYNSALWVGTAIQSALDQTCAPCEIIVIDDGSADDTAAIAETFPVRVLRQRNGGPGSARNAGIREAKGDWIALLDADDSWLPTKLEQQLPYLSEPMLGVLSATTKRESGAIEFDELWNKNCVVTSSAILRKTAVQETGYFDEDRRLISVEDYNLWLRMAVRGWTIRSMGCELIQYAPAPGNLSSQTERMAMAELINLEKMAALFRRPEPDIRKKRALICSTYGLEALHLRKKLLARKLLREALRSEVRSKALIDFGACFLPDFVLDLRARIRAGLD